MVELFCDSFEEVPRRIVLDIDDTEDRVHGGQQLALFHAHYDSRCFLPIHIYEATTGKPVAVILRPGKTPGGAEVALVLRHVVNSHPRPLAAGRDPDPRRQPLRPPRGHDLVRAQPGRLHLRPRRQPVLLARVADLAEDAALGRIAGEGDKVRRYGEFRYAARSWQVERRVIGRIEASAQGSDSRFIITNLAGAPRWLYESRLLPARPGRESDQGAQAAPRLGSDLLHQRHRQPVPPADPHRRLLAPAHAARPGAEDLVLARRPVRHHPPGPDQGRRPGHRDDNPDQGGAAVLLSAPDQLGAARRPCRQAPALTRGAACPDRARPCHAKPDHPRRRRHPHPCPENQSLPALMNDPDDAGRAPGGDAGRAARPHLRRRDGATSAGSWRRTTRAPRRLAARPQAETTPPSCSPSTSSRSCSPSPIRPSGAASIGCSPPRWTMPTARCS